MSISKQEEFLKLYEPNHDKFERFCRARVYGNMEYNDLMNETLLVAFDKFETLKSNEAFLSFLFTISVRILSSHHRKIKERNLSENDNIEILKDLNRTDLDTDLHFLYESLSKLNEKEKESIILFEISGFSIKEISKMQNSSQSAVKQRLRRGRKKLVELMTFDASQLEKEVVNG